MLLIVSEFWGSNKAQGAAMLSEKRPFLHFLDLNCICNQGCQSSTVMLNPYPWWFLPIHPACEHGGQQWTPPSPWQIWQGLSMWWTDPPSLGAVSWGSQTGAKEQRSDITDGPTFAALCCFLLLFWFSLTGIARLLLFSPAQVCSWQAGEEQGESLGSK